MSLTKVITVSGIKCPRCWDHIWSKYRHDFHYCFCGYCFVDGGMEYLRFGWGDNITGDTTPGKPDQVQLEVEVTIKPPRDPSLLAVYDYLLYKAQNGS